MLCTSAIIAGITSCQLFENDVADFMEKYTETAAIETHEFNVQTYDDALSQLCISSEEDTQISLYMRNPKQFTLIPSVTFPQLSSGINTATVAINQTDKQTIMLSLPQSFLVPADEGNNITAEIRLYEPMSGRDFDRYKVNLHCNTIPPQIQNPTILNDGTNHYVIAFDMPNEEEVALRHTDISELVINGTSYPVNIPNPVEDTSSDMSGVMIVEYAASTLPDSHFTKSTSTTCPYTIIEKTFDPTNNTYYFLSNEPLIAGDKQYTIELKDSAGLKSSILASTSISKLNKPVVRSVDPVTGTTNVLSGSGILGVPYDEDAGVGIITITPPTQDHRGHSVSGSTVHYRIYEATGNGHIYTSGTTTTTKTIELPQNTYRVEAYATLTNYEQSSTESLKIRLMNNVIYIKATDDPNDDTLLNGDGSALNPFPTIQDAIADIATRTGDERKPNYTLYVSGDFTTVKLSKLNPSSPEDYGRITIGTVNTDELVIAKWPGAAAGILSSLEVTPSSNLQKFKTGDITFSLSTASDTLELRGDRQFEIDRTVVTGNNTSSQTGIKIGSYANVTIRTCTITNCDYGIIISDAMAWLTMNGGTITGNTNGHAGINLNSGRLTLKGGTVEGYTGSSGNGIFVSNTSTIELQGGTVTGNTVGIEAGSSTYVKVSGNPVVTGNQSSGANPVVTNLKLTASTPVITIDGPITAGANIGITTVGAPTEPGAAAQTFTSGYREKVPVALPSSFFSSDTGLSVVLSGYEAGLVVAGASGQDMYGASDYTFTLAATDVDSISNTLIYSGAVKKLKITPTITRTGGATLHYNYADHKLYTDSGFTTVAANGNTVTWTAEVLNGGVKAFDVPASGITDVSGGVQISFTAPANPGDYSLKVHANFLGMPHNHSFPLTLAEALTGVNVNGTHYNGSTMAITDSKVFIAGREFDIPNLWVCDHETTQKEYKLIIGSNPSYQATPASGEVRDNLPVESMYWYDILVYCNKRSILEGLTPCYSIKKESAPEEYSTNPADWGTVPSSENERWNAVVCNWNANGYRMPTEAEWEYCARGADLTGEQFTYVSANTLDELLNYAWYYTNSNTKTHEVKKKLPNALGLYDMCGNVWEWLWDKAQSGDDDLTGVGPYGLENVPYHIRHGGSRLVGQNGDFSQLQTSCRIVQGAIANSPQLGFRVVRTRQ